MAKRKNENCITDPLSHCLPINATCDFIYMQSLKRGDIIETLVLVLTFPTFHLYTREYVTFLPFQLETFFEFRKHK